MTAPRLPTPDDQIPQDAPPLRITVRCACGKKIEGEYDYAIFNPRFAAQADAGWDGLVLSRIVTCPKCGAVDDYALAPEGQMVLMAEALRLNSGEPSRLILGESRLWDGTRVERPSRGLAHLRAACEAQPRRAEVWRRLGNGAERWGRLDEALEAWKRAIDLDPEELDARLTRARHLWEDDAQVQDALHLLEEAVAIFPKVRVRRPEVDDFAPALAAFVQEAADTTQGGLGLMVAWNGPKSDGRQVVVQSEVAPTRVRADRLAELFTWPAVVALGLVNGTPEPGGNLEALLSSPSPLGNRSETVRAAPKVERNAPCPCGSGKKAKKCCHA